jgi:hypothetical protein
MTEEKAMTNRPFASILILSASLLLAPKILTADDEGSILNRLKTIATIASTVPGNGDVNPYGAFQVPRTTGNLQEGHILVSNFNAASNFQGTGTTIVDISPDGAMSVFAHIKASNLPSQCTGGVGLTTALVVLRTGWVIVGSLPTKDGTAATAKAGCLIVLDREGNPVETFFGSLINGPWDMTVDDGDHVAKIFVTNVLNGTVAAQGKVVHTATVLRMDLDVSETTMPFIESMIVIGSGFPARTDPMALVIGPTGVGLSAQCISSDADDCPLGSDGTRRVLYVADSLSNRVAVIPDATTRTTSAGMGVTLTSGGSLNDPLGLTVAPNGHILTVNGDDGFITEISPKGQQIAKKLLNHVGTPPGSGALFGLAFDPERGVVFVDDSANTLNALQ